MENESQFCINTYTSLNNTSDSGSCWIFRFGARGMFLGYEMFENFDWARDDTNLSFLRCWRRKKKCICIFVVFMSLLFVNKAHLLKKKKKTCFFDMWVFCFFFFFSCSWFTLKPNKTNA